MSETSAGHMTALDGTRSASRGTSTAGGRLVRRAGPHARQRRHHPHPWPRRRPGRALRPLQKTRDLGLPLLSVNYVEAGDPAMPITGTR